MEWLDGARFADTNGFQNDFARIMWPWRDWVIAAFNRNQPFDRFLIDQVAGDLLPGATLAQKIATGFNRNNRTVTEAGSIEEEWRVENAVDRVETTATVFLGLTMGCARCHDHKFDPISQTEFYQFLGFFNSVNEKGVYTETRGNVPPLISLPTERETKRIKELDSALAAAKKRADKKEVEKLAKEKESLEKAIASVMVMEDTAKPRPTFVLKRGPVRHSRYRPACRAGCSRVAAASSKKCQAQPTRAGRVAYLARESADRSGGRQPHLAASFRHGPGENGRELRHSGRASIAPRAARLARERAHSLGVGYQGHAQADRDERDIPAAIERDARAARSRPRKPAARPRPEVPAAAEVVRDNALAIGGLLVKKIGGPSVKPYQPAGLWEELAGGAGEAPYVQDKGPGLYRRSLYVYRKRTVPHPLMATFDAPSREVCQVKRPRTNTPLQALELLNDLTYVEAARQLAQLAIEQGGEVRLRPDQVCVSPGARARAIAGRAGVVAAWAETILGCLSR